MIYGSVCSGIEAATEAWHPLGWKPAFFSEIDNFPRAYLQNYYPDVPLHGRDRLKGETLEDYMKVAGFQTIKGKQYGAIDLLVGGTPCQSFSVAGLRNGLDDDRGNLALEYIRMAEREQPRWFLWENVPGVFTSNGGQDFQCFLSGIVGWDVPIPKGGWKNSGILTPAPGRWGLAWRVLDAQYFGVPQRRRRVFVVGYFGDWRPAAAVLFERESLRRDTPPRREKGEVAPTIPSRRSAGGGLGTDFDCDGGVIIHPPALQAFGGNNTSGPIDVATALNAHGGSSGRLDFETETFLTVPIAFSCKDYGNDVQVDVTPTLRAMNSKGRPNAGGQLAVAFAQNSRGEIRLEGGDGDISGSISAGGGKPGQGYPAIITASCVRRLIPEECEILQGFPVGKTKISYRGKPASKCPDGPRYKALGNTKNVFVVRWLGHRIQTVDDILKQAA